MLVGAHCFCMTEVQCICCTREGLGGGGEGWTFQRSSPLQNLIKWKLVIMSWTMQNCSTTCHQTHTRLHTHTHTCAHTHTHVHTHTQTHTNRGTKSLTYQVNCQKSTITVSNYCNMLWSPLLNIMLPYILCMFCWVTAILHQRNRLM
jgi:hypothetical protein